MAAHRHTLPPPGPRPVLVELTDEEALTRLLDSVRPEAVVHAAAIGQAGRCQERPDEAHRVNAVLPGTLGRLCRERGLRLVALSTDLVFRGDRAFVREDDTPAPLSVYGRTKLAGEEAVLVGLSLRGRRPHRPHARPRPRCPRHLDRVRALGARGPAAPSGSSRTSTGRRSTRSP